MQSCLRLMRGSLLSLSLGVILSGTGFSAENETGSTAAPDNTERNKTHDGEHAVTADQQKNNETDVEITRKIRRAITSDKSLSTYAHNVKIIAMNGAVTLKGPVKSEKEKTTVEAVANKVAGTEKVTSEIEVSAQ